MSSNSTLCAVCGEHASGKSKLFACSRCNRHFHNACQRTSFTRDRTCSACQIKITSARVADLNNTASRRSSVASNSTSSTSGTNSRQPSMPGSSPMLDKIYSHSKAIEEVREEQRDILTRVQVLKNTRESSGPSLSVTSGSQPSATAPQHSASARSTGRRRTNKLEPAVATQVTSIVARYQSFSSSIVIGGISLLTAGDSGALDLRCLALTVLRAVDPCVTDRMVISARLLGSAAASGNHVTVVGVTFSWRREGGNQRCWQRC